jgi:hypothetical protein
MYEGWERIKGGTKDTDKGTKGITERKRVRG